jgi:hypothetical protein
VHLIFRIYSDSRQFLRLNPNFESASLAVLSFYAEKHLILFYLEMSLGVYMLLQFPVSNAVLMAKSDLRSTEPCKLV